VYLLDDGIEKTSALVIDANATSRGVLCAHLRSFGVGTVRQTSNLQDARNILEHQAFDIILCEHHFERSTMSGPDLLADLRRAELLPYYTVFVMVTGEATYERVTEAAETALDSYLLKPYSAASLGERLIEARRRKRELRHIFEAIQAKQFDAAAALCRDRFVRRGPYWLYAARIGAELYLRIDDPASARQMYDAVLEARALPWARLGIARTQVASGQLAPARRTLDVLIGDAPDHADSYDVLGHVQIEQGELGEALQTFRKAAELTPGSVTRLQHAGTLAFYAGEAVEALDLLDRAARMGVKSRLFDPLALVLLAMLHFDARDGKALGQTQSQLGRLIEAQPEAARLRHFERVIAALRVLHERRVAAAVELARELALEHDQPGFDMERGCNVIGLWVRLNSQEIQLDEMGGHVAAIARRLCVSKATCEMLVAAAQSKEPAAKLIRDSHAAVSSLAERAMGHSVNGQPRQAVQMLLDDGETTRNAKLIELAALVTQRHHAKIDDSAELLARADALKQRYCQAGTQAVGTPRRHRSAGGLTLRA
jgi:CheY-like chemotaxis protein